VACSLLRRGFCPLCLLPAYACRYLLLPARRCCLTCLASLLRYYLHFLPWLVWRLCRGSAALRTLRGRTTRIVCLPPRSHSSRERFKLFLLRAAFVAGDNNGVGVATRVAARAAPRVPYNALRQRVICPPCAAVTLLLGSLYTRVLASNERRVLLAVPPWSLDRHDINMA
jgi:hypothetical protein